MQRKPLRSCYYSYVHRLGADDEGPRQLHVGFDIVTTNNGEDNVIIFFLIYFTSLLEWQTKLLCTLFHSTIN